jgi:hypothetical protein
VACAEKLVRGRDPDDPGSDDDDVQRHAAGLTPAALRHPR